MAEEGSAPRAHWAVGVALRLLVAAALCAVWLFAAAVAALLVFGALLVVASSCAAALLAPREKVDELWRACLEFWAEVRA